MHYIFPYIVSVLLLVIAYFLDWSYKIEKFDKVLDSIITFSSIIIGFLGALLGILITIRDTGIMKKIYSKNIYKKELKFYFYETIIIGFIVIVLTTIMYLVMGQEYKINIIIFYAWLFVATLFFISSFNLILKLMSILFKSDIQEDEEQESNDCKEQDEVKKNMSKDTSGLKDTSQRIIE